MDNPCSLMNIGGIVFLAYTIMAAAYWHDMTRLGNDLRKAEDEKEERWIRSQIRVAQFIFRACTGTMLFTIIIVVLPYYFPDPMVTDLCRYALLIPLVGIVFMCLRYTMGQFYVKPMRET